MQRKNKSFNKQVVSLLLCIIAAFSLWVYVTYVEDPSFSRWQTGIPITVVGENELNEKGLAISYMSTEKVDVKFSAPRSRFKYLSEDLISAKVDVSRITSTGNCEIEVIVTASSDFTIVDKRKTTVTFEIEEYIKDKVFAVKPSVIKSPDNGYFVKYVHLDDKDVQISVSGAESAVNSVSRIITNDIDLSTVADNAVIAAEFIPVDQDDNRVQNVKLSLNSANLTFVIYKTALLPVTVSYRAGGDNPKLDCALESPFITVTGPASAVDKLTSIETAPINEYNYSAGDEATVALSIPDQVTVYDKETAEVKLKFTKN